jgi:hypothetical protein
MMDLERAARWRKRAEECRTLAEIVKTPTVQTDYLGLARTYDTLADNADAEKQQHKWKRPLLPLALPRNG